MSSKIAALVTIGAVVQSGFYSATGIAKRQLGDVSRTLDLLHEKRKRVAAFVAASEKSAANAVSVRTRVMREELSILDKRIQKEKQREQRLKKFESLREEGRSAVGRSFVGTGVATAATVSVMKPLLSSAISLETSQAGLAKQIQGARDEEGRFTQAFLKLSNELQDLGKVLPIPIAEIFGIAEAARKNEVSEANLVNYTLQTGKVALAFETSPEEISRDLSGLMTIYKLPETKFGEFADVINYLDDEAAVEGKDLIKVMTRVGGMAQSVNMPWREAAALSTAFLRVKESPEVASTSVTALIRELAVAKTQGRSFQEGLSALGLNAEDVQTGATYAPTGMILHVLTKLSKLEPERQAQVATQLFGKEYGDNIAKISNNIDIYTDALMKALGKDAEGSVEREYKNRLSTTDAQLILLNNRLSYIAQNLGTSFLPSIKKLVERMHFVSEVFATFSRESPEYFRAAIYGVFALMAGALIARLGMLFGGIFKIARSLFGFLHDRLESRQKDPRQRRSARRGRSVVGRDRRTMRQRSGVGRVASALGRGQSGFASLGLLRFLGVAGMVITAAVLVVRHWKEIREGAARMWEGLKFAFSEGREYLHAAFEGYRSLLASWVDYGVEKFNAFRDVLSGVFEWVAEKMSGVLNGVRSATGWVEDNVSAVGGAYDWARGKTSDVFESVAGWWKGANNVRADAPAPVRTPPVVPRMAGAAQSASSTTNNHIQIVQQPGQDQSALAREVVRQIEAQKAVRARGGLYDLSPAF